MNDAEVTAAVVAIAEIAVPSDAISWNEWLATVDRAVREAVESGLLVLPSPVADLRWALNEAASMCWQAATYGVDAELRAEILAWHPKLVAVLRGETAP